MQNEITVCIWKKGNWSLSDFSFKVTHSLFGGATCGHFWLYAIFFTCCRKNFCLFLSYDTKKIISSIFQISHEDIITACDMNEYRSVKISTERVFYACIKKKMLQLFPVLCIKVDLAHHVSNKNTDVMWIENCPTQHNPRRWPVILTCEEIFILSLVSSSFFHGKALQCNDESGISVSKEVSPKYVGFHFNRRFIKGHFRIFLGRKWKIVNKNGMHLAT